MVWPPWEVRRFGKGWPLYGEVGGLVPGSGGWRQFRDGCCSDARGFRGARWPWPRAASRRRLTATAGLLGDSPVPGRAPVSSECPYSAYYAAAKGSLPAAVGVQPEPGQFPLAVLRVVRKYAPRGVAGRSAWQVQDEVVILSHCLLLCASRRSTQVVPGEHAPRRQGIVTGNTLDGMGGCRDNGRDGHFAAAPRMVLAADVTPQRGGDSRRAGPAMALM